jgi:hypothetical protein
VLNRGGGTSSRREANRVVSILMASRLQARSRLPLDNRPHHGLMRGVTSVPEGAGVGIGHAIIVLVFDTPVLEDVT